MPWRVRGCGPVLRARCENTAGLEQFLQIHAILSDTAAQEAVSSLDTLMAMLAAAHGEGHHMRRERAYEVLAEEAGVIQRAFARLDADLRAIQAAMQ